MWLRRTDLTAALKAAMKPDLYVPQKRAPIKRLSSRGAETEEVRASQNRTISDLIEDLELKALLAKHNSQVTAANAKYDIHGRRVKKPKLPESFAASAQPRETRIGRLHRLKPAQSMV